MPTHSRPIAVVYPDSDGEPIADNTLQYDWIVRLQGNLDGALPNAFVAGSILWYPVQGDPGTRIDPDVLVALDRPKGYRGSYRTWEEGRAPDVIFEVLSPGNTLAEMIRKWRFYDRFGVQEYYVLDPDRPTLTGWVRRGGVLDEVIDLHGFVSPLLGIRYELSDAAVQVYHRDGRPFLTFVEQIAASAAAVVQAAEERRRADEAAALAAEERCRADVATAQAAEERQRAEAATARAAALAEKLRALGLDPEG